MAPPAHTFGAKCRLAPVPSLKRDDERPPLQAQFFYSSLIPIDDPLSTGAVTTSAGKRSVKGNLRPFSRGDNNALEKAWLGLYSKQDSEDHDNVRLRRHRDPGLSKDTAERLALLTQDLAAQHVTRHRNHFRPLETTISVSDGTTASSIRVCCTSLLEDVTEMLQNNFCAFLRLQYSVLSLEVVAGEVMKVITMSRRPPNKSPDCDNAVALGSPENLQFSHAMNINDSSWGNTLPSAVLKGDRRSRSDSRATRGSTNGSTPTGSPNPSRASGFNHGITGKPFIRVNHLETAAKTPSSDPQPPNTSTAKPTNDSTGTNEGPEISEEPSNRTDDAPTQRVDKDGAEIAVGLSRLHMVSLPLLQMKPIYWSPVNDIAVVSRATWFYRDTMLPIPSAVANQLEAGYHELRPWSETWNDELRCAIDIGPAGEEKISHRLWREERGKAVAERIPLEPAIQADPYCAARCIEGSAAAEGVLDSGQTLSTASELMFRTYHVAYRNATEAFLLKPSLRPSAYYGRRPILKITRGFTVGVPVVRGINRGAWDRVHHKKQPPKQSGASAATQSDESRGQGVCPACKSEKDRNQATDLVLVAHGIGQKFAERVESFHFTHAINGFRRALNEELGNPIVRKILREDQNGLMILPLNWRMGLSFEDGGPIQEEEKHKYTPEGFGLKDIEPDTIPAIRSMISDVMFDIPFYMSHHKGKMIQALISEANRVYRLWCRNNPGFAENGRVHLIGHSLGSAMSLEILSRQPTLVPKLDLSTQMETRFFEFDTKNLFLVGSPAGFFLLLQKGALMPRRGRSKPGADPNDITEDTIVGEAGTFGCLAVDNIYNVLAKEDPIAYLLNGAVDPGYSASLKKAFLPSTATSIFKSMGNAMRQVVPGMVTVQDPSAPESERLVAIRLPSQLELEIHDFTREEIAEKKALLLNDNGQIDWFLQSTGGPLEIQYLNMLSAHSSYWYNQDFVRMLCVEIGRKPGKENTLPAMRAVKTAKVFTRGILG